MSPATRIAGAAAVASALSVSGCGQKTPERPPYADQSCEGTECKVVGRPGGGGSVPPSHARDGGVTPTPPPSTPDPDTSAGDTGPQGDPDGGLGLNSVAFDLQEATDLERTFGQSLGKPYAVYAWPNVDAPIARSMGLAPEPVAVASGGAWLLALVTDVNDALDPNWLPVLTWQVPSADPVGVPVFHSQFWEDLAAGLAMEPTTTDAQAAQVLLRVTNKAGQPLVGVSADALSGVIAYGNGGTASDVLTETDDSGLLVWFNAPAGEGTTLTLGTSTELWTVVLPTRAGSVTVAAVAH